MKLQQIKKYLPTGSYHLIARSVGKSPNTIKQLFSNRNYRISRETEQEVINACYKIIEKNCLNGLSIIYGNEKKKEVKKVLKQKPAIAA